MTKPNIADIIREHFKRLGQKGGKVKSQAKCDAARANGKRGGRKPKRKDEETK